MAENGSQSQDFFGNIANIIPESPLMKMIPLMEDHGGGGGGVHGDPRWLMDYMFISSAGAPRWYISVNRCKSE